MLPGETLKSGASATCEDCVVTVYPCVMQSQAGYFIGTKCNCGPCYTRESGYYATREDATEAFMSDTYGR